MNSQLHHDSIEEVQGSFRGCRFSDDEEEVRGFLKGVEEGAFDGGGWSFRGLKSAKYKLLTSLQREWVKRELANDGLNYGHFVHELLDATRRLQAQCDDGVPEEIRAIEDWNELGLLSYLQHYDCPTPLLDFTTDIRIALFFAIQELKAEEVDSDLDQYLSIYSFHEDILKVTNGGLLSKWKEHVESRFMDTRTAAASFQVMTIVPVLVHDKGWYDKHFGYDVIPLYNNERIEAQKGLFISNSTPTRGILDAVYDFVEQNGAEEKTLQSIKTYVNCMSIHRKFVPLIEDWLRQSVPWCTVEHLLPKRPEHDRVKALFLEVLKRMKANAHNDHGA